MNKLVFVVTTLLLAACASSHRDSRDPASTRTPERGQVLAGGKYVVQFTVEDRGWNSHSSDSKVIEATKSYLISHETDSRDGFAASRETSEKLFVEQCAGLGDRARISPETQAEGYDSKVTSKIINAVDLPDSYLRRRVCVVSALATKR